ncbi:PA1571 family protein [Pseudomonas sp. dw_358]|uniref:PA1571 family protein n=1 Tax=Pseudomonas sp. dw_358 TaxID=2720083 RepID=UPI001BD2A6F4|nr:PA1571 family protein [Pseudomonas sp. dw_358]
MNLQHSRERDANSRQARNEPVLGGSFIDAQGREVPITEEMIQSACLELEKRLVKPARGH